MESSRSQLDQLVRMIAEAAEATGLFEDPPTEESDD